ncbi:hypothetical protein GA0061096_3590 [Fictibacillus enclensis]|nr:hypothetical protein GA0061096_3590 [Fictibacillus enclensis]
MLLIVAFFLTLFQFVALYATLLLDKSEIINYKKASQWCNTETLQEKITF